MNLFDYQTAAAATAQPAAYSHDYLIPMIVGEIGELFGQKAKSFWHGWGADKLQLELVSEYGDVCWGTAILLETEGVYLDGFIPRSGNHKIDPWQRLLTRGHNLHQWYLEAETRPYIRDEAQKLWVTLREHAEAITGTSFENVLQANLDKLASRAARGVLQGAGDHR